MTALGRAEAFVNSFDAERDQAQVSIRLEYLNSMWASLEEVQGQLEDSEDTEEGRQINADIRADFEPRLFQIRADLISKLPVSSLPARIPENSSHTSALSGLKLPTISLPEFNGDYMQWLGFHDTFLALFHSNGDVPSIQKFHYLKAALKGEASQLIESIAISSANYNLAWQTLVDRYANDYLLKKRHLQALFDISSVRKESAAFLHALVDEFQRHTKTLGQLGEPTDSWSSILEHLLCTKLPSDTLKSWEDHASTNNQPNYDCLIEFLQRRMRVLESVMVNHHQPPSVPFVSTSTSKKSSNFRLSSCASTSRPGSKCPACNQEHPLMKCAKFSRYSPTERQQFVSAKRLCHNCLKSDHIVRNCPSNYNCKHCNMRHHSMLHSSENSRSANEPTAVHTSMPTQVVQPIDNNGSQSFMASAESVHRVVASTAAPQPREYVFLLTALVKIIDAYGQDHTARALLDSGSQPNLITDRLARSLHLKRSPVNVTIQGAGNLSKRVRETIFARIKSQNDQFECGIEFLLMDTVTADLPAQDISVHDWQIPQNLVLDPLFNKSQQIDMVLGAKHFHSFFPSTARLRMADNLTILVDSVFGWVVTGSATTTHPAQLQSSNPSIVAVSMLTLEESMERFWKTEELTVNNNYFIEERYCEDFYQSTTTRDESGRYIVRLPRKPDFDAMLGESKNCALRCFSQLERRLDRDETLKKEYHKFIKEYLSLGHMRLVEPDDGNHSHTFYLPHHPVLKEDKEGIVWHLTPPKAPNFGGLWEAAVKTAKRHLFRQLGSTRLSFEDYYTILHQIEAAMNSRPLLPMSDDPNNLAALTPGHFLTGSSLQALPDPDLLHTPVNALDHLQRLQQHVQKFWSHWRSEYLQELIKDTKRAARNDEIQPGRMVILVDEMLPAIRWPLARITQIHPGSDNLTRVVTLRTAKGIITRPITKICLLPVPESTPEDEQLDVPAINHHPEQQE
ncbi:uncharacterized protein LOC128740017 [Sabethes cyaneus]|uniref:uncharacterized protein LOC128740017 n=1 Tax=Sabethes cyaneus TaxID=53552 RepID=UPI00237D95A2|nr:uncharacterized protein LOC128740017 [Sabethes cyaneus]